MREIKFRVWDKNGKTMYHCSATEEEIDYYYLALSDIGWTLMFYNHEDEERMITSDAYGILMQYTGTKDKNEKDIYDGDILNLQCDELSPTQIVFWWDKGAAFRMGWRGEKTRFYTTRAMLFAGVSEVIGNIYENKELLNESD